MLLSIVELIAIFVNFIKPIKLLSTHNRHALGYCCITNYLLTNSMWVDIMIIEGRRAYMPNLKILFFGKNKNAELNITEQYTKELDSNARDAMLMNF